VNDGRELFYYIYTENEYCPYHKQIDFCQLCVIDAFLFCCSLCSADDSSRRVPASREWKIVNMLASI
jgi:hypothetical protein